MKVCEKCFKSNYLQGIIKKNSNEIADCDFCGSHKIKVLNALELKDQFLPLLDTYLVCTSKHTEFDTIEKQIVKDFSGKIFTNEKVLNVKKILLAIFEDEKDYIKRLLTNKVCLDYLQKSDNSVEHLINIWDSFSEEIKYTNRFHLSKSIDLTLLSNALERHVKPIKFGSVFYRGRISNEEGFSLAEMKNPPKNKTVSGRANPKGISYLYLTMDEETTLYEVRALLYDFVTITKFSNKEFLRVINLNETDIYDPFQLAEAQELSSFLQHLPFVKKLRGELSKPIRRFDDDLDYIPTQYLCEFIKSLGYDGIEYKSSLNKKGSNLAIFYPEKFEALGKPYIKEITDIKYTYESAK